LEPPRERGGRLEHLRAAVLGEDQLEGGVQVARALNEVTGVGGALAAAGAAGEHEEQNGAFLEALHGAPLYACRVRHHWALFVVLTGCASVGALQPAQTLGKNNVQVGLEVSEQALVSKDVLTVYPMLGVSARYGLFDRLDVGIRFGPSAFEAQVKAQLTPREPNRVIVSVAPLATLDWADNDGVALRFYNFA